MDHLNKSPPSSFPLFNKLPTELRLRIWELSLPGPRIVLLREESRNDGKFVEFEAYVRQHELRCERRKDLRSQAVHQMRLGEEFDIIDWEEELIFKEWRRDFMDSERSGDDDPEDDEGDEEEDGRFVDGDDGEGPGDDDPEDYEDEEEDGRFVDDDDDDGPGDNGPYGNGLYDDIQELWTPNRGQIKQKARDANSTSKEAMNRQVKQVNIPHKNLVGQAGSPMSDKGEPANQPNWRLRSMCKPPALLYTCRESAFVAYKTYHNAFNSNDSVSSQVYFDFNSDTLYLDTRTF